ncbi:MAG: hypothetical protein JW801_02155 [Bacteroidales bacterium]|nr:hypothetical protein [Bacteroidales bacterium]
MGLRRVLIIGVCLVGFVSCKKDPDPEPEGFTVVRYSPVDVNKGNPMEIYVHYMPWFEDKSSSENGNWGSHWTMGTMNPDEVSDGRRAIASHYYPLIGPYASGDPDVLEYHLLLMKYSGISGVLIDWYGSYDVYDYGSIRENTEKLIGMLAKVGLKYAIVYEDRTIEGVLGNTSETDALQVAGNDMLFIEENYFNNDHYIEIDGNPLLLVFGPERFHTPAEWTSIFSSLFKDPLFLTLNGTSSQTGSNSSGEYIWVNQTSLDYWYGTSSRFDYFMGGAYPGFNDFYEEGGWGEGLGWEIAYDSGATFERGLQKAAQYNMEYLQLITWNDFGEGTMIEPTLEFGYTFLNSLQEFAELDFGQNELDCIYELYRLRNETEGDADKKKLLDQVFYYLVSVQTSEAKSLLDSISGDQNAK